MIMARKKLKIILILLACAQTLFLVSMLVNRNLKLIRGTEVILESRMLDPRDLFRGHYVNLSLAISRTPIGEATLEGKVSPGAQIYTTLKQGDDRFWVIDTISEEKPAGDQPFLKAAARFYSKDGGISRQSYLMRFPFDRYFAEKKNALALEKINRDGKLGIIVMVDDKGSGAIKGLLIDGESIYDEPLF